jgi:hypothetical protein
VLCASASELVRREPCAIDSSQLPPLHSAQRKRRTVHRSEAAVLGGGSANGKEAAEAPKVVASQEAEEARGSVWQDADSLPDVDAPHAGRAVGDAVAPEVRGATVLPTLQRRRGERGRRGGDTSSSNRVHHFFLTLAPSARKTSAYRTGRRKSRNCSKDYRRWNKGLDSNRASPPDTQCCASPTCTDASRLNWAATAATAPRLRYSGLIQCVRASSEPSTSGGLQRLRGTPVATEGAGPSPSGARGTMKRVGGGSGGGGRARGGP